VTSHLLVRTSYFFATGTLIAFIIIGLAVCIFMPTLLENFKPILTWVGEVLLPWFAEALLPWLFEAFLPWIFKVLLPWTIISGLAYLLIKAAIEGDIN
jgi:hypothetical protein